MSEASDSATSSQNRRPAIVWCIECGSAYPDASDVLFDCVTLENEYTDGRRRWCPSEVPPFFVCRKCKTVMSWREGRERDGERPRGWRLFCLREAKVPSCDDVVRALAAARSEAMERALRIEAWRASNDPRRDWPDRWKPMPETRPKWSHENMRAIRELETDPRIRAEVCREVGDFAQCLEIVREVRRYDPLLEQVRQLAKLSNPHVQALGRRPRPVRSPSVRRFRWAGAAR